MIPHLDKIVQALWWVLLVLFGNWLKERYSGAFNKALDACLLECGRLLKRANWIFVSKFIIKNRPYIKKLVQVLPSSVLIVLGIFVSNFIFLKFNTNLQQQKRMLEQLQSRVKYVESVIHTFEAKISFSFSGDWSRNGDPTGKTMMVMPGDPAVELDVIDSSGHGERVFLHLLDMPRFNHADSGQVTLEYRATVRPGDSIFQRAANDIIKVQPVSLVLYGVNRGLTTDGFITFHNVIVEIFVNGKTKFRFDEVVDQRLRAMEDTTVLNFSNPGIVGH